MYIHEAVNEAREKNCFARRTRWPAVLAIVPTNTAVCCILYAEGMGYGQRWEPKAEDLMADDWEAVAVLGEGR